MCVNKCVESKNNIFFLFRVASHEIIFINKFIETFARFAMNLADKIQRKNIFTHFSHYFPIRSLFIEFLISENKLN